MVLNLSFCRKAGVSKRVLLALVVLLGVLFNVDIGIPWLIKLSLREGSRVTRL